MIQILKEICNLVSFPQFENEEVYNIMQGIQEICLINCNKSERDIICMSDLQSVDSIFARYLNPLLSHEQWNHSNIKFKCSHVLENADKFNKLHVSNHKLLHVGRLHTDLLRATLPPPSDQVLILVSGSSDMLTHVCGNTSRRPEDQQKTQGDVEGILKELGYTSDMVYKF
ncbi:hypothetical protein RFI_15275 [Reticulomyxa filosa]|uniref:Uncharacterized protein n=1 Tax=Reticulomyxa filosa TaxID=46433 RepID=X6N9G0_RETFI|nr:hypothetical protein RFI_15275 [Reticulomyxa filosa]|eukprot:ETO21927.1 hypothetical protein RFI_15275 [Reticulomyxa filosa]